VYAKILIIVAGCLTYFFNTGVIPFELSWSFSIWLEALAIIPQLHMIMKLKEVYRNLKKD
jgi:ER lumen protein retaining receptor